MSSGSMTWRARHSPMKNTSPTCPTSSTVDRRVSESWSSSNVSAGEMIMVRPIMSVTIEAMRSTGRPRCVSAWSYAHPFSLGSRILSHYRHGATSLGRVNPTHRCLGAGVWLPIGACVPPGLDPFRWRNGCSAANESLLTCHAGLRFPAASNNPSVPNRIVASTPSPQWQHIAVITPTSTPV